MSARSVIARGPRRRIAPGGSLFLYGVPCAPGARWRCDLRVCLLRARLVTYGIIYNSTNYLRAPTQHRRRDLRQTHCPLRRGAAPPPARAAAATGDRTTRERDRRASRGVLAPPVPDSTRVTTYTSTHNMRTTAPRKRHTRLEPRRSLPAKQRDGRRPSQLTRCHTLSNTNTDAAPLTPTPHKEACTRARRPHCHVAACTIPSAHTCEYGEPRSSLALSPHSPAPPPRPLRLALARGPPSTPAARASAG